MIWLYSTFISQQTSTYLLLTTLLTIIILVLSMLLNAISSKIFEALRYCAVPCVTAVLFVHIQVNALRKPPVPLASLCCTSCRLHQRLSNTFQNREGSIKTHFLCPCIIYEWDKTLMFWGIVLRKNIVRDEHVMAPAQSHVALS